MPNGALGLFNFTSKACDSYTYIQLCLKNEQSHTEVMFGYALRFSVCTFCIFFLFYFILFYFILWVFTRFRECGYYSCTVSWTIVAKVDFSTMNSAPVYCLRTHKFHFSTTFSLKMSPTVLFTYLKIILLQCFQFSVFSFSKINSIQTDPKSKKLLYLK